MNGLAIAGVLVMVVGGLMVADYKDLGLANPAGGVLVIGGGFLMAAYGFLHGERVQPRRSGQRVKDASV